MSEREEDAQCVPGTEAASAYFVGFKHECSAGEASENRRSCKWRIKTKFFGVILTVMV